MKIKSCASIEEGVRACFGENVSITGRSYVGGGDINDSFCLSLSNGKRVFVKSNSSDNAGYFDSEEQGLEAIASVGVIGTPKLLCKGTDQKQARSFLMMEMIESSGRIRDFWEVFGRELAMLHLADAGNYVPEGRFGFYADNYIGAGVQKNTPGNTWVDFFRECRLEPQIKRAEGYFDKALLREISRLLDRLDSLMPEPVQPSLLHGDLWSGNFITGEDGKAWLIDPGAYVGHAEADLAMTELFGRFNDTFYRAYETVFPLQDGYRDRRDLYNLYHLLNHLNLFGRSYLSSVLDIVHRYA